MIICVGLARRDYNSTCDFNSTYVWVFISTVIHIQFWLLSELIKLWGNDVVGIVSIGVNFWKWPIIARFGMIHGMRPSYCKIQNWKRAWFWAYQKSSVNFVTVELTKLRNQWIWLNSRCSKKKYSAWKTLKSADPLKNNIPSAWHSFCITSISK